MLSAVVAGFLLGGSLIVAIGAQNAFVIRQGVVGSHIFWICLFCAVCDALLIWSGVFGLGVVVKRLPWLIPAMTWGGAAYLCWHGVKAVQRVLQPSALGAAGERALSLSAALAACAGFTLLNPHVYLDTVILVGSIANARPPGDQAAFAAGASLSSFVWFFALGYGARALSPVLGRPSVWRAIDAVIAAVMFLLAGKLLLG